MRLLQTSQQRSVPYFINEEILSAEDAYLESVDYIHDALGKFEKIVDENRSVE